jgi:hypothetical protein
MASPFTVRRNNYRKKLKSSTIYTPDYVCQFLHDIICPVIKPKIICDPAIGKGALVQPWRSKCRIVGVDIDNNCRDCADEFICSRFEDMQEWSLSYPDLVLCNPPFNGAGRDLYPEVFLRNILRHFGPNIPIVLFTPMGLRLNQKTTSKRWQWLRDNGPEISGFVSLPLNVFEGVQIQSEILLFNLQTSKPHYWLGKEYMAA